jgi:TRAP-type transport system periplasmic protein
MSLRRSATFRWARSLALITTGVLVLAACGSDDPVDEAQPEESEEAADEVDEEETTEEDGSEDVGESADEVVTMRFASSQVPGSDVQDGIQWWADRLEEESGGSIQIEMFDSGTLLENPESIKGVVDGRADIGFATLIYHHPGEIPLGGLWFVPGVGNANAAARMNATLDLAQGDTPFAQSWADNGVRVLAVTPIAPLGVGAVEPIEELADFEGLDIRSGGAIASAYAAVGANPQNIQVGDVYESLNRGLIDAWGGLPMSVGISFGLHEVAPHLFEMAELQGIGNGQIIIGEDLYQRLSDGQKEAIERTTEAYNDFAVGLLVERETAACQTYLDVGGSVTALSDSEREQWLTEIGDSLVESWVASVVETGMAEEEVRSFLAEFEESTESYAADSEYVDGFVSCREQAS